MQIYFLVWYDLLFSGGLEHSSAIIAGRQDFRAFLRGKSWGPILMGSEGLIVFHFHSERVDAKLFEPRAKAKLCHGQASAIGDEVVICSCWFKSYFCFKLKNNTSETNP